MKNNLKNKKLREEEKILADYIESLKNRVKITKRFIVFDLHTKDYDNDTIAHDDKFFKFIVEIDNEESAINQIKRAKQICNEFCEEEDLVCMSRYSQSVNNMIDCVAIAEKKFIERYHNAEQLPALNLVKENIKLYTA